MSFLGVLPIRSEADRDDWPGAVFMWRGYCLELFSRAEYAVSQCLEAFERSGAVTASGAHHPGAHARLRELRAILETTACGGHERVALQRLEEWSNLCVQRAWLAHGRFRITDAGVTVELRSHDGKTRTDHTAHHLTALEMLALLDCIEKAQIALVQQLGQVRASAMKREQS